MCGVITWQSSNVAPRARRWSTRKQQRELRRVGRVVEHALAGEDAAGVDAVQAAGERVAVPRLDAVRVAGVVQARVRRR